MDFTPRGRQILIIMLECDEIVPVKKLADEIAVSKRTVQRELSYMEYVLKKYNISLLSKPGFGIWLEGKEEDKAKLLEILKEKDDMDVTDKEERRLRLILELLKDKELKKLYYYANLFSVSETTISKDMERIEPWFLKYNLCISRKQGVGVGLEGSEKNYRLAIREFIAKYMDTPLVRDMYEGKTCLGTAMTPGSINNIYNLLDDEVFQKVCRCFSSLQDSHIFGLTEESYRGLVIHVTIAMERVLLGEIIEVNKELGSRIAMDDDYNLSILLTAALEEEFSIEIPEEEVLYICLHIKGAKKQRIYETEIDSELKQIVREMIVAFNEELAPVLEADDEFVNGLVSHLQPTMVRLKNFMPIENPHLNEIKELYPDIYKRCEFVGQFLKARIGYKIPDTEVGFLAIHFGAALVRHNSEREKGRRVRVGLVCASGIGISRLMSTKLTQRFGERIKLETYGKMDMTPFIIEKNDFFVSSMDLDDGEADIIHVSPLLPDGDLHKIDSKIRQYAKTPKKHLENMDFSHQLARINHLSVKIKQLLWEYYSLSVDEGISFTHLVRTICKEIADYERNQQIIQEDILKREEIATQIIPELGIGLLHARTKGVFNPAFYTVKTSQGTCFTDAYMQGVQAIVIMLIPDDEHKEENSSLMGAITEELAENENFLRAIKEDEDEVVRFCLSSLCKRYFNKYIDMV